MMIYLLFLNKKVINLCLIIIDSFRMSLFNKLFDHIFIEIFVMMANIEF